MSTSGVVFPPIYNSNPLNPQPDIIFIYGEPLVTRGFENCGVTNGLGQITNGLIWQLYDMWVDVDYYKNQFITTTWTAPQYGMFGPYPTI